jgi:hypothetical protein
VGLERRRALLGGRGGSLILRTTARVGRLEFGFLGLVTALVAWTWLSSVWSIDLSSSVLDGQRGLVLIGAVVAVLALAPARPVRPLLGAVFAATTLDCAYALATRLFPGRIGSYDSLAVYRLNTPVGYWNGLGVFAAIGAVVALGFAARGTRPVTRALAAASLLVLVPTLYFTFGRGAWLALFAGLVVLFALDPRRLQLAAVSICVLVWPALAVLLASRYSALTRQSAVLPQAAHDGHRLALALLLFAVLAAASAMLVQVVERNFTFGKTVRVAFAAALVAALLVAIGAGIAHYGSPPTIARKGYDSFTSKAKDTTDLNARLFSLSSSGRTSVWHVAWQEVKAHPVVGGGAGSYARYYLVHRTSTQQVQDAHSLYLETLAELGPLGLALLLAALALPLVAAVRMRRHPLVPAVRRLSRPRHRRLGLGARGRDARGAVLRDGLSARCEGGTGAGGALDTRARRARRHRRRPRSRRAARADREHRRRCEQVRRAGGELGLSREARARSDPLDAVVGRGLAEPRRGAARRA